MRIVITGGFGFVGARLTRHFLSKGCEVTIFEHPDSVMPADFPPCEVIRGDITDEKSLERLKVSSQDALLHLAAQSSGPRSFSIPVIDVKVNILGTLNIINWCLANEIPRILFASSFVIYGDHPELEAIHEDVPCLPKSVYATSKLACEHLLKNYAELKGLKWNALRMFNVYGPGQDISRPDQGVAGIFMNMLMKQNAIQIKGSLDRFRDLVFIDDVISAWDLCLHSRIYNTAYNLGCGNKITFRELISTLIDVMQLGPHVRIEELPGTPGDMMGCYADLTRIKTDLGYQPQNSLKQGLSKMWSWVQDNSQQTRS
jgi:UDP-glucose 4-epimerase